MQRRIIRAVVTVFGVGLAACGGSVIENPKNFHINAQHFRYPVMLSATGPRGGGRPIEATSGQGAVHYRDRNVTVSSEYRSLLPVLEELNSHLHQLPGERWMQIENAEYVADETFTMLGSSSNVTVSVKATVRR